MSKVRIGDHEYPVVSYEDGHRLYVKGHLPRYAYKGATGWLLSLEGIDDPLYYVPNELVKEVVELPTAIHSAILLNGVPYIRGRYGWICWREDRSVFKTYLQNEMEEFVKEGAFYGVLHDPDKEDS